MGNDISRQSLSSMKMSFADKSNYINETLSNFFGPIDGFSYAGSKQIGSLEKYDDPAMQILTKDRMDALKEERQVCANLILSYTDALDGMLADSKFKNKVEQFVKDMKIHPENLSKLSVRILKSRENDVICNDVINYYFLKYRVYRLIRDFDPYEKEFEYITKTIEKNASKYPGLNNKIKDTAMKRYKALIDAKNNYHKFASYYIEKLIHDDITYPELESLYRDVIKDKSLSKYCQSIYHICDDVDLLDATKDLKNFNFRDLGMDATVCGNVNLTNYKKIPVCKKVVRTTDTGPAFGKGLGGLGRLGKGLGAGLWGRFDQDKNASIGFGRAGTVKKVDDERLKEFKRKLGL